MNQRMNHEKKWNIKNSFYEEKSEKTWVEFEQELFIILKKICEKL